MYSTSLRMLLVKNIGRSLHPKSTRSFGRKDCGSETKLNCASEGGEKMLITGLDAKRKKEIDILYFQKKS